jgi:hypothetical protein
MGYLWNSYMRERDKQLKADRKQRAERAAAAHLRRLIAGVRGPVCWQEAYVAKYLTVPSKVPANAGVRLRDLPRGTPVPPTILCTCPEGHQYQVQNGQLLPPSVPPRRVRG